MDRDLWESMRLMFNINFVELTIVAVSFNSLTTEYRPLLSSTRYPEIKVGVKYCFALNTFDCARREEKFTPRKIF
jgi:hypothetical protein